MEVGPSPEAFLAENVKIFANLMVSFVGSLPTIGSEERVFRMLCTALSSHRRCHLACLSGALFRPCQSDLHTLFRTAS